MNELDTRVDGAVENGAAKLTRVHNTECLCVELESPRDEFFQEFFSILAKCITSIL